MPITQRDVTMPDNETIVKLASGWTLRSGPGDSGRVTGDYVRLCRPDGTEEQYWDNVEWHDEPVEVMGAIIAAAATTADNTDSVKLPILTEGDRVVIDGRTYNLASIGTERAELRRVNPDAEHEPHDGYVTIAGITVYSPAYNAAPAPVHCPGHDDDADCDDDPTNPCKACYLFDATVGRSRWPEVDGQAEPVKPVTATCKHCGRRIVHENGRWIDPEATSDDAMWRETCDSHDTATAEHEPDDEPDYPATPEGFAAAQAEADRMADEADARIAAAAARTGTVVIVTDDAEVDVFPTDDVDVFVYPGEETTDDLLRDADMLDERGMDEAARMVRRLAAGEPTTNND